MKIRLRVLVGLAIGLALPAIALDGNLAGDVKALEEFGAFGTKYDEHYNQRDAAARAALFTEYAVLVTPEGLFSGRQAIQKWYINHFQRWQRTNKIGQTD